DQRVRVEVALPAGRDAAVEGLLAEAGEVLSRGGDRARVLVPSDEVRGLLDKIVDLVGPGGLSDLRVQGPSLEDVYLQLGGEDRLG
ncbi:MAG: hypothetical protein HOV83_13955, partial [Catenulispora sp.]|nr:hypothetical protein [Catenulispora sp.]